MHLTEHAAKLRLEAEGIAVPRGGIAEETDEAVRLATDLGGKVVLKALVPMGKRGKAGLVRFAKDALQAGEEAERLFATEASGYWVDRLRIEEQISVASELYLAIANDTRARAPKLLFSTAGGMDVEQFHETHPERIVELALDPRCDLDTTALEGLLQPLELESTAVEAIVAMARQLYRLFRKWDAELLEINPLAIDTTGRLVALDCKLTIDDASTYRQPDLPPPQSAGTELERRARAAGLYFIELEGNVGILANGAGLTMATLDTVAHHGGAAANFIEIGGDAYRKATEALSIVLANPNVKSLLVNLCGAYARTDVMMEGFLEGWRKLQPQLPVFFSIHGTGEARAVELLRDELGIESHDVMDDAVRRAVQAAQA